MATLYVVEYSGLNQGVPLTPPVFEQQRTIQSESQDSLPFKNETAFVSMMSDADCHIAWTAAEDVAQDQFHRAKPTQNPIPANEWLLFAVEPGGAVSVVLPQ